MTRPRETVYEAAVCLGPDERGFIAHAAYDAPNESFYIQRRGRTRKAAVKALYDALCLKWRPMPVASADAKKLWKLIEAIDKEIARP